MIPEPWEFALVALAAWRLWKLLAEDTILDRLRNPILFYRKKDAGWVQRKRVAELIECPYCLGAWISIAWVAAYWIWAYETTVAAVPFAVSAAVGLVAQVSHRLAED